jgi:hypothetical protein
MKRRDFLKYRMCGLTAVAPDSINLPPIFGKREARAAGLTVDLCMEEALVEDPERFYRSEGNIMA